MSKHLRFAFWLIFDVILFAAVVAVIYAVSTNL
jgi:hypothetical protein